MARPMRIGKVKGRFCATSKKALRTFACSQKVKCRPKKIGKAVIRGKISGIVYCCMRRSRSFRKRRRKRGW